VRGWEYFERVRAARQKAPDLGAKRSHSLAMASICNDKQVAFDVLSGHDRNTLSLWGVGLFKFDRQVLEVTILPTLSGLLKTNPSYLLETL